MTTAFTILPILPELSVLSLTCVTLLLSLFVPEQRRYTLVCVLAQVSLFVGAGALGYLHHYDPSPVTAFQGSFILDPLALLLKLSFMLIGFLIFTYSARYVREHKMCVGEYYVLSLFSILGMMLLVSSRNLLILFLGLELFSLPLYALVALRHDSVLCAEAAIKYFVMGALATGVLLYGFSLLYGLTGHINLADIAATLNHLPIGSGSAQVVTLLSLGFIGVGLGFKLGVIPFHMWVPDVYEGAPTPVTLFIASIAKLATFGLFIRLLVETLPSLQPHWKPLLIALSLLSIAGGNIMAVIQVKIKRLLAYSAIAHMGYMLLGLIVANQLGYSASLFYLLTYTLITSAVFGLLLVIRAPHFAIETLDDLKGLNQYHPGLAFMLLLTLFALAGVPPIVGFMAKFSLLEALIQSHLIGLAVFALLFAVVGVYYYLRIVKYVYFDAPLENSPLSTVSFSKIGRFVLTLNCLAVAVLGIFPTVLFNLCRSVF